MQQQHRAAQAAQQRETQRQVEVLDAQALEIEATLERSNQEAQDLRNRIAAAQYAGLANDELAARQELLEVEGRIETFEAGLQEANVTLGRAEPETPVPQLVREGNVIRQASQQQQTQQQRPLTAEEMPSRMPNLSAEERDWIRAHPDSITDQANAQLMRGVYLESEKKGIRRSSPEYFRGVYRKLCSG